MKADYYIQLAASCPVKYSENFWTGYRYWVYENNDGKQERGEVFKEFAGGCEIERVNNGKDRINRTVRRTWRKDM